MSCSWRNLVVRRVNLVFSFHSLQYLRVLTMDKKKFDPDVDLYELLGVSSTSSVQEIKKAYRKKALTCHPDKNPDNPKAAELFHELSNALEILIDESARAAYDRVLSAKKAARLRHRELDAKRKKFKEDLEAREKAAQDAAASKRGYASANDEERLQAEVTRLRKEGSRLLAEEMELMKEELRREAEIAKTLGKSSIVQYRLRLKWTASKSDTNNGGYTYDNLHKMFRQYGEVVAVVLSPKKQGSALIEFSSKETAEKALRYEKGLPSCPLSIETIGWNPQQPSYTNRSEPTGERSSNTRPAFSCFPAAATTAPAQFPAPGSCRDESDFELLVLRRLKEAQEQKKFQSVDK